MVTANYRTPDHAVADGQRRQADRYERLGQTRNADAYREAAAASELLGARIAALLSVERGEGQG